MRVELPLRRNVEIELIHHYLTDTYKTLTQGDQGTTASNLLIDIPRLALQHSELLDAIFAFTALHIASKRPQSAAHWTGLALEYKHRALGTLRQSVASITQQRDDISAQEVEAIFNASLLIAIVTFIELKNEAASFVDTIRAIGQLSLGSTILEEQMVRGVGRDGEEASPSRERLHEDVVEALRQLRVLAESEDDSDGLRIGCVVSLQACFGYCARGWCVTGGTGWPVLYQYSILARRAPRDSFTGRVALFIGVLLHTLHDRWWAEDVGRLGVVEVSSLGPLQNTECLALVKWARHRVGR